MAKLQTYGLPVVDGADQDYYDRAYARTQDALTGISKTANVQGQLSQFLSDGTGGGVSAQIGSSRWPGFPTAPDIPTPPPPSGGGGGPSIGPPPVYQPHPDNETTSTHQRPVYRGPSQSNEDLFADLMANVQGGGGGGAPPPPPAGGGDGGGTTQPPPPGGGGGGAGGGGGGGETGSPPETPNLPYGYTGTGHDPIEDAVMNASSGGVQVDDRRGGSYFQQDNTREILESQSPLDIDWGDIPENVLGWIKDKAQNWDMKDSLSLLVKLAAGIAFPGGGVAVAAAQYAIAKLKEMGLDEEGNPLPPGEGNPSRSGGGGGGEATSGGGGYGSGYSGSQTGLGSYGNMTPGSFYHGSSAAPSLPGMGGGGYGGGGYGGFLGGSWLTGGGGWGQIAPIKKT